MNEQLFLSMDRSELETDPFLSKSLLPLPAILPPAGVRDDVLSIARRGWEERARSEYIGVMVVRRFHGLLVDVNAPLDIQELALKMLLQEQQHASLCMIAARALGSEGELGFDLRELQQPRTAEPVHTQLAEMICATYGVGEVIALALIRHSIEVLPRSPYRDILRDIARDEVLHGRIGTDLLRLIKHAHKLDWLEYPGDEWIRRMAKKWIEVMRARDVVEAEEEELFRDPAAAAQLASLGIPPSEGFRARYHRAIDEDVPRAFESAGVKLG